jgi:DNA mismatch endonuclease, patch repair protein
LRPGPAAWASPIAKSPPDPTTPKTPIPQCRVAPSYAGCTPASELSSGIKRKNGKVGTRAELALRRALWWLGLRYRVNDGRLPGRPDLVLARYRAAIFVDGDFWHGRDWETRVERLKGGSNGAYWVAKIAYNRERDRRNDSLLADLGWRVRRLWETDVLKDPEGVAGDLVAWLRSADQGRADCGSPG